MNDNLMVGMTEKRLEEIYQQGKREGAQEVLTRIKGFITARLEPDESPPRALEIFKEIRSIERELGGQG